MDTATEHGLTITTTHGHGITTLIHTDITTIIHIATADTTEDITTAGIGDGTQETAGIMDTTTVIHITDITTVRIQDGMIHGITGIHTTEVGVTHIAAIPGTTVHTIIMDGMDGTDIITITTTIGDGTMVDGPEAEDLVEPAGQVDLAEQVVQDSASNITRLQTVPDRG